MKLPLKLATTSSDAETAAKHLGIFRFTCFGLWLLTFDFQLSAHGYSWETFETLGVFHYLPEALSRWLLSINLEPASSVFLMLVFAAAAVGAPMYRLWAGIAAFAALAHDSLLLGYSHIVSNIRICILLGSILCVITPAAERFNWPFKKTPLQKTPSAYSLSLLMIQVTVLLTYTLAGAHRLAHNSLDLYFGDSPRSWLIIRNLEQIGGLEGIGITIAQTPALLLGYQLGLLAITIIEAMSLLCLNSKRFTLMWLIVMSVFHLLSHFTMHIFFWQNMVLIWVLFWPFKWGFKRQEVEV